MKHITLEHTGLILKEEFMEPYNLSMNALARAINVQPNRIHGILHGERGITADTDLRLSRFFGLSEGYFLRLQDDYEMRLAKKKIEAQLKTIVPISMQPVFAG